MKKSFSQVGFVVFVATIVFACVYLRAEAAEAVDSEREIKLQQKIRHIEAQLGLLKASIEASRTELLELRAQNARYKKILEDHGIDITDLDHRGDVKELGHAKAPVSHNDHVCLAHHRYMTGAKKIFESEDTSIRKRSAYLKLARAFEDSLKGRRVTITGEVDNVRYEQDRGLAYVIISGAQVASTDPKVPSVSFRRCRGFLVPMTEEGATRIERGDAIEIRGALRTDTDFSKPAAKQPAKVALDEMNNYVNLEDSAYGQLLFWRAPRIWLEKRALFRLDGIQRKWK